MDGSKNMLKILVSGTTTVPAGAERVISFSELPYQPAFIYYFSEDNRAYFPYVRLTDFDVDVYIDVIRDPWTGEILSVIYRGASIYYSLLGSIVYTTNQSIVFHNYSSNSVTFRYYIFEEIAF